MSHYVKIYYGPFEEFFILSHKPQKLYGLRDELLRLGFRVDLVPVETRNYCMIEMSGTEVFRCNISNLLLNLPHALDPVCDRAVAAVRAASEKLERADIYFWLEWLIFDQTFKRTEYALKDSFPTDIKLKPLMQCKMEGEPCCTGVLNKQSLPRSRRVNLPSLN